MPISTALRKHGTFIYEATATIQDYGSVDATVKAAVGAGMSHTWVRIHRSKAVDDPKETQALIDGLKAAGIAVAGWGWCQGADPKAEAKLAKAQLAKFGLTDYVADIEEEVNDAHWTTTEIKTFLNEVRPGVSGTLAITTFPLIDWHSPELMAAADPLVDAFAPQVYWFNFPNKKMVKEFKKPGGGSYSQDDPVEYATLCLDRWAALTSKPIVLTGQSYWGENAFTQQEAQEKLDAFLSGFSQWSRIIGLNWWHFGGSQAMSHHMLEAISRAQLGTKPYQP